MIKLLIDTGHGWGCGNGSPDGALLEYKWADEIAARLVQVLSARHIECAMITPEIRDTPLKERVKRVNDWCAIKGAQKCLLLSLHLNADGAGKWTGASGFSAFVSKNASRKSKMFAELLTREAERRGLMGNRAIPSPDAKGCRFWAWTWRKEDIYILARSKCPAVLTESAFMTNREDYARLMSAEGREMFVEMHADAIAKYIDLYG